MRLPKLGDTEVWLYLLALLVILAGVGLVVLIVSVWGP